MEIDRPALLRAFLSEAEEELESIEHGVLALEEDPGDLASMGAVFRAAHTLKGNAATLSLDAFSELAHALEDVLDAVRGQRAAVGPLLTTRLLAGVDGLRSMLGGLQSDRIEDRSRFEPLIEDLRACAAATAGREEPAARPSTGEGPARGPSGPAVPVLRVEIPKLDELLGLAARLQVVQGQIGALLFGTSSTQPELWELHEKGDRLLMELQDWVMDARMVPVASFFRSHVRTVRDAARSRNKQARLHIEGEQVRVDTAIGDGVRDALTHLVRNAIDHGIEPTARRMALGKPAEGTITLRALQSANQVVIQVSDDGAGLNLDRIRARARAMGRPNVDALSAEALQQVIFEPGFSTAEDITDLSGRGVGMDAVRRRVEALHGTVDIDSVEGAGTTIELRLPLTVSVIEGFWVEVAGTDYVLPLDDVIECLELRSFLGGRTGSEGLIEVRNEPLAVYRLRQIFGAEAVPQAAEQVVVVRHDRGRVGLAVDAIHGQRQTVIKPLGRLFRTVPGISGSTLRSDGRVALVVDVPRLLRSVQRPSGPLPPAGPAEAMAGS
jgi:two-component system chemotaxis sensor kinase CheA